MKTKKLMILIFTLPLALCFLSFYVPKAKAAAATYEYVDNLYVRIRGETANLAGWYAADQAGGWGTIGRSTVFQYYLIPTAPLAYVQIGDGANLTTFYDFAKQIDMASVIWYVYNNATLQFGMLSNETLKTGRLGVEICRNNRIEGYAGSTIYLYSCAVQTGKIVAQGTSRFWGCEFDACTLTPKNTDFYSCVLNNAFFTGADREVSGSINRVYGHGSYLIAMRLNYNATLRNIYFKPTSCLVYTIPWVTPWSGWVELINVESTNWGMTFSNPGDTGIVYEKYSVDITLTYQNGTNYQGANVTLAYYGNGGGSIGTFTTNSSGQIPTQTIIRNFFNITDSYTYNPYNALIEPNDYMEMEWNFTLVTRENWNFAVFPQEYTSAPIPVFLFVLIPIMFIAVIVVVKKR